MVCGIRERKLLFSPPSQQFSPAWLCVPILSFTTNGPFLSFAAVSYIVIVIYAATLMMYSVLCLAARFLVQCIINESQHQAALDAQLAAKREREMGRPCGLHLFCGWKCFPLREITI